MGKLYPRRYTNKIIIHCAATPPGLDIGAATIRRWHLAKGWADIGYHYVIRRNGVVEGGRPVHTVGAHTRGQNSASVGICMVGGVDNNQKAEDNFTEAQWRSLHKLVDELKDTYSGATIHGHNEFAAKACPSFDVKVWQRNPASRYTPVEETVSDSDAEIAKLKAQIFDLEAVVNTQKAVLDRHYNLFAELKGKIDAVA
jgi:hypothetical protein